MTSAILKYDDVKAVRRLEELLQKSVEKLEDKYDFKYCVPSFFKKRTPLRQYWINLLILDFSAPDLDYLRVPNTW